MGEITAPSKLLNDAGQLCQVGWSRQPILESNLENVNFTPSHLKWLQGLRIKRWDYYAVFTPKRFFSATLADLGYAGNIFVYILDFAKSELKEETKLVLPGRVKLPTGSDQGLSIYQSKEMRVAFQTGGAERLVSVDWPAFDHGKGLRAELTLSCPPEHESMNIVIPFNQTRFYFNRKINCLKAEGILQWGDVREEIFSTASMGQLDWGRGIWPYQSFWNWASASGFLYRQTRSSRIQAERIAFGLNLGQGFGDTSQATENAFLVNGRIHKLGKVDFIYDARDYNRPWLFKDDSGRLDLMLMPTHERVARTNLPFLSSEVHQMLGRYTGRVVTDEGDEINIDGLPGFAEEHQAKW